MYGNGFWASIEVTAWGQGGDYGHYLHIRQCCTDRGRVLGGALTKTAFDKLCQALDAQLEEDFERIPDSN